MIPASMENPEYDYPVAFQSVKQLVREAVHERATKSAIVNGVTLRIANQGFKRSFDLSYK
jgi:hypothetical protein